MKGYQAVLLAIAGGFVSTILWLIFSEIADRRWWVARWTMRRAAKKLVPGTYVLMDTRNRMFLGRRVGSPCWMDSVYHSEVLRMSREEVIFELAIRKGGHCEAVYVHPPST